MQDIGRRVYKLKNVRGYLITFILFIGLLLIKNEYSEVLLENATYGMPALIKKGHVDNLFIGSSVFRQGLSIDVLDDNLNDENYILTYNGNEPFLELLELNKLIDNGVDIGHVYVDMYAYSMERNPRLDDEKILMELNLREKVKLYNELDGHSISKWWQMFVSSNNDMILTWPINKGIIDSRFRNGGTLIESVNMDEEDYNSVFVPDTEGVLNETQVEATCEIIDLCRENDIQLTFIETPKAKAVMNHEGYRTIMQNYESVIRKYSVEIIRADVQDMTYNDYSDDIHLSSNGRIKYTKWLLNQIK